MRLPCVSPIPRRLQMCRRDMRSLSPYSFNISEKFGYSVVMATLRNNRTGWSIPTQLPSDADPSAHGLGRYINVSKHRRSVRLIVDVGETLQTRCAIVALRQK